MENIKKIIKKYLRKDQILVDFTENFDSGFVRVVVDSASSITLGDTTSLTRKLINSDEFDRMYPNGCRIEITTPGVDTPLTEAYQFRKNVNKNVKIRYRINNNTESIKCRIISANENAVFVKYQKSDLSIPYDQIEHAKVLLSFK
tara:strand:+ start:45 stop:479 length:435 start_codon:yes stop_codon:yes gene_type:complete